MVSFFPFLDDKLSGSMNITILRGRGIFFSLHPIVELWCVCVWGGGIWTSIAPLSTCFHSLAVFHPRLQDKHIVLWIVFLGGLQLLIKSKLRSPMYRLFQNIHILPQNESLVTVQIFNPGWGRSNFRGITYSPCRYSYYVSYLRKTVNHLLPPLTRENYNMAVLEV